MKTIFLKVFILTLIVLSSFKGFSADSTKIYLETRNCFRGTVFFTRATLAYERAIKPNVSLGMMYSLYWARFPGVSAALYGRVYANQFNKSGFFGELDAMYGHFTPYVYSSYSGGSYYGKHRGNLNYYAGTLSGGYKAHTSSNVFWEFMIGARYGYLTKGIDDKYIYHDTNLAASDSVEDNFFWGPGFPLVLKVFMGIDF